MPHFRLHLIIGLALTTLAATAVPALALTPITSCSGGPYIISTSGNYAVTANLTSAPGADCIDIQASNVSLTLNGHIINGGVTSSIVVAPASSIGINVSSPGGARLNHVGIEGPGLIVDFYAGIGVTGCDYCQVALVTAAQNQELGIYTYLDTFLTLASNVATANGGPGIQIGICNSCTIEYNEANGNSVGIQTSQGSGNTYNNNRADSNERYGIELFDNAARVYSNVTNGNRQDGIVIPFGVAGNEIFNNSSSVGNGRYDLNDINPSCGSDFWSNNVFFTSNPAPGGCIR